MRFSFTREEAIEGARRAWERDARWSYLALLGIVLVGALINVWLPHGWTVWPMVLGAGIMMWIHEAAERTSEGVPPFHVYALFGAALLGWLVVVFVLSVVNPLIVLLGVCAVGYQVAQRVLAQRQRRLLVERRRLAGLCVYCGAAGGFEMRCCDNCGEDPDPEKTRLGRVAYIANQERRAARVRAALAPETHAASAKKREQTLLARSRVKRGRK